ncbi:hypothetical protein BDP27DRAFT_1169934, partial [Rhodocollybia butyracea]
ILYVYGECGEDVTEHQFNDWYDNEHAPLRLTVPGFFTAARYKALDVPPKTFPKWMAMYDMASKEVMKSQEYKGLSAKASANERQVVGNLKTLDRRVYELIYISGQAPGTAEDMKTARFIYAVHMHVVGKDVQEHHHAAQEENFIQWYTSTRIPLLTLVPGYIRSRVFRLTEQAELAGKATVDSKAKSPFKFLAIHEWDA